MENRRKVKHAIKRKFPVIDIDSTIGAAMQLMADANVSVLVVKNKEDLIGILTVSDVMCALCCEKDPSEIQLTTFMTKCEFHTKTSTRKSMLQLDEDEDVLSAVKVMHEAGANHLLITGEKSEPLGIVSSLELIRFMAAL